MSMILYVADVNQKHPVQGERRNRRALGDIGNLVPASTLNEIGKPQLQITRPITRFVSLPSPNVVSHFLILDLVLMRF